MKDELKKKLIEVIKEIAQEEDIGFGEVNIRIQDFKAIFIRITNDLRV